MFLLYDLFDPVLVYCSSFSSCMVTKIVDFCYEKVYVSQSICKKRKRRIFGSTEVLVDADKHLLT